MRTGPHLMTRGGAAPKTPPTGWAYLRRTDCTIRWQRGSREAHVLTGNMVGSWTMEGLLGRIPVPRAGWADLAEVRSAGQRWVHAR